MKKRSLLLFMTLLFLYALTACAGEDNGSVPPGGGLAAASGGGAVVMEAPEAAVQDGLNFSASSAEETRTYAGEDAKLIQRAEVTVQVTDFTAAENELDALVESCGGYYESASVQGGGYYDQNAARYGNYVVRVPKERYEALLSSVGDVGHVVSLHRDAEDVGETYFDMESRLRTQETKRERLLALLERAENMEDIISLENALSEAEYQIEQYSTQLRRYDSLVDFATVTIAMEEVIRVAASSGPAGSMGVRISAALSDGFAGAGEALGNFVVWCAYHLTALLVLAVVLGAGGVILVRRHKKRTTPPLPAAPAEEQNKGPQEKQ